MTAEIVSAYVANHAIEAVDLPALIRSVRSALLGLGSTPTEPESAPEPAVPIKKSVFPDYIVCLEDGKKLKMLKRHLKAAYGMTPNDYRAKWGLPDTYPMVAPKFAEVRSDIARKTGLGRLMTQTEEQLPLPSEPAVQIIPARRRGLTRQKAVDSNTPE